MRENTKTDCCRLNLKTTRERKSEKKRERDFQTSNFYEND